MIFKLISGFDGFGIFCKIALRWMLLDLTDGKSTLATVLGLVPDDAKPLPEPMLIQLFLTYMASLGYNELISFLGRSCGLRSKAVDYISHGNIIRQQFGNSNNWGSVNYHTCGLFLKKTPVYRQNLFWCYSTGYCQWTGSTLVQVMACRLFCAKPLPEPVLTYCQLNP